MYKVSARGLPPPCVHCETHGDTHGTMAKGNACGAVSGLDNGPACLSLSQPVSHLFVVSMCARVWVCLCVLVCVHTQWSLTHSVSAHPPTHTHTHTHTHPQTHTPTHTHTRGPS